MAAALSFSIARLHLESCTQTPKDICFKKQMQLRDSFFSLLSATQEKTLSLANFRKAVECFNWHMTVLKGVQAESMPYEYLDLNTTLKTHHVAGSLLIRALDLEKPLFINFDQPHREACALQQFYACSFTETRRRLRELSHAAESILDSIESYHLFLKYIKTLPRQTLKVSQQFALPASTAYFFFSGVVSKKNIECIKKLGEGTYGIVFHVNAFFKTFAYKEFKTGLEDAEAEILHESSFYLLIPPHPHLLKLEAISCKGLFFELASTDFYHRLKDPNYRYETLCKHFFELASALGHIHAQGYNYKDLKPSNILVFPDDKVKLCDLGFLEPSKDDKDRVVCAHFAAPEYESTLDTIITPKADVWAFGVCLFQALTPEKYPILDRFCSQPDYFQRVLDFSKTYAVTEDYLFQNLNTSEKKFLESRDPQRCLLPIVAACLRSNPKDRPSTRELEQFFHEKTFKLHPSS